MIVRIGKALMEEAGTAERLTLSSIQIAWTLLGFVMMLCEHVD